MLVSGEPSDEGVEGATVEEAGSVLDGAAVDEAAANEGTVDDVGFEDSDDEGLSVGRELSVGAALLLGLPLAGLNGSCPGAACKEKRVAPVSQQPTVGRFISQQVQLHFQQLYYLYQTSASCDSAGVDEGNVLSVQNRGHPQSSDQL